MHLTLKEIASLLKTWNGWYLISHDELLQSEYSDNKMQITINPCPVEKIPDEVMGDLENYTDYLHKDEPGVFGIDFVFSACEHQPDLVLKALKPVIDLSVDGEINIVNSMEFIEEGLPSEEEVDEELDERVKEVIRKYKDKPQEEGDSAGEGASPDSDRENEESKEDEPESTNDEDDFSTGKDSSNINKIEIRGIIKGDHIQVEEILHNNHPLEDVEHLIEASRLFDTVEMNFPEPDGVTKTSAYECNGETEAEQVKMYLATCSDYRLSKVEGSLLNTAASPEELASVISYVRYKDRFKLFSNPHLKKIRHMKAKQRMKTLDFYKKSCSCLFFGFIVILILIYWLIITMKNK